jgi:glycosyltransferase involved in cell wall biosynthesis
MQTLVSRKSIRERAPETDAAPLAGAAVAARPTVCHVLHTLHVGGGEMLARAFALENAQRFRPVFALLDELGDLGRDLREQGYQVEVLGRRPGFDLACARKLKRFFRTHDVRVVHAHQYGPLLYSTVARLPWRRIPILFTEHGRDYPDYRRWKRVWANRLLLSRKDRFVAVGEYVRRALIDYEGLPASRVQVVHNGRDLDRYDPAHPLRGVVRAELGLAPGDFVIIQVARLNRLKDHPTALRAMRELAGRQPFARLLLVGDGEDRSELERLIDELDLRQVVRLLGSRDDVPRLLQAADAFLLTSISEGIPLTLIEAMATGLPCVATRVGGVPEVVDDGESGLLAESGNDAQLASHLNALASDALLGRRIGQTGCERVATRFGATQMHVRYRTLYEELAATSSRRQMCDSLSSS